MLKPQSCIRILNVLKCAKVHLQKDLLVFRLPEGMQMNTVRKLMDELRKALASDIESLGNRGYVLQMWKESVRCYTKDGQVIPEKTVPYVKMRFMQRKSHKHAQKRLVPKTGPFRQELNRDPYKPLAVRTAKIADQPFTNSIRSIREVDEKNDPLDLYLIGEARKEALIY